jgi:tRNA-2-methylthio-N6-dimethylallyladenosine synthase
MKKYFIQTFGCQMNQADSEKVHMVFLQSGFQRSKDWQEADIVICNTCSVRQKGEDRVFGLIRDIKKNATDMGKEIFVGVTGCMVRKTGLAKKYLSKEYERKNTKDIKLLEDGVGIFNNDDPLFPRSERIDFVFRIEETKYIPLILTEIYGEKVGQEDKFDDYLKQAQQRENPFSASVIIQTGCDNYCSFCIVPYTRGKEVSRERWDILEECRIAAKNGAREITLLGQNVNSYGKQFVEKKLWNTEKNTWNDLQWKSPFRILLDEIDEIEWIERIRFTSSNPHDMTRDILDAHFELNHICNYLHFALQSGSNELLKKMNRKHTYEDFRDMVSYLRKKDPLFSISTDIIVGFSGETEEMFEDTLRAFKECEFDYVYTARYSVRPQTLAAKLFPDDVPDRVKSERWHTLNAILLKSVQNRNELILGRKEEILVSGEKDNFYFGRTRNFKEVFFEKTRENLIGKIVSVEITELDRYVLHGKIL